MNEAPDSAPSSILNCFRVSNGCRVLEVNIRHIISQCSLINKTLHREKTVDPSPSLHICPLPLLPPYQTLPWWEDWCGCRGRGYSPGGRRGSLFSQRTTFSATKEEQLRELRWDHFSSRWKNFALLWDFVRQSLSVSGTAEWDRVRDSGGQAGVLDGGCGQGGRGQYAGEEAWECEGVVQPAAQGGQGEQDKGHEDHRAVLGKEEGDGLWQDGGMAGSKR